MECDCLDISCKLCCYVLDFVQSFQCNLLLLMLMLLLLLLFKLFPVVSPSSLITSVHSRFFSLQVPTPLTPQRRRFLAMKWLITAAREQQKNKNKNARMYKKLAKELIDAYNNEVRKRLDCS